MNDEKASMILTDMPYNIGLDYDKGFGSEGKYGGHINDNKSEAEYSKFVHDTIKNGIDSCGPDVHVLWYTDENYVWLVQTTYMKLGAIPKRLCVWAKNSANPTPDVAFNKAFEMCVYGTIGKPKLNPIHNITGILNKDITTGNEGFEQLENLTNLWTIKRLPTSQYSHPTQKSPELHEKPLRRCSKPNDIVLDLFGGAGGVLIACEQLNRKCYTMEIEPIFCDVILERYEKLTGIKPVLIGGSDVQE
jgi:DNA modification methylase